MKSLKYSCIGCIIFVLLSTTGCYSKIRKPAVAVTFYPGDQRILSSMIEGFLESVPEKKISGDVVGLILPHAGYVYSGQVAAYGTKQIENKKYDTVILIGPSHNFWLNKAAVDTSDVYHTPLGDIPVDKKIAAEIAGSSKLIEKNIRAHIPEHCLEVELPFLQTTLKEFKIVPILISRFSMDEYKTIAESIASVSKKHKNKKFLYVISTDMSHYPSQKDANYVDKKMLKALNKYDPLFLKKESDKLLSTGYPNLNCVLCGEGAVITGIYLMKTLGADRITPLHYANSGDVSGDSSRVVGYCAVAFTQKKKKKKEKKKMEEFSISSKNQKILLELARKSITEYLESKKTPSYETTDSELTEPAAVFVTLNLRHNLRGCIGTTVPRLSLYKTVQQMALAAAFEDYRFGPVTKEELKDIKIEISVLSPLKRVKSADEIKPKIHGVVVRRDSRSGLFLPQVWEHFSKKEDFLSELCWQKARLDRNAWKDPKTELHIFTVFAFEE
jgi:AmmeMemoRadiSam system protein B/AmmeMemoRadiSam system protein A